MRNTGSIDSACCTVMELRQYTVRRGSQAMFKRLFATTFVAPQLAVGIKVLGWFDDLDDPDRFVWIRGFSSMDARAPALASFYGSATWKSHRTEANAMIVDSDNVLLLRPLSDGGVVLSSECKLEGTLSVTIHYLPTCDTAAFDAFFLERMVPRIVANGGTIIGRLCSHDGPNDFPSLPIRAGECVYVWIAKFDSQSEQEAFSTKMHHESGWRDGIPDALLATVMRKPEVIRLRT